jgi:trehalose/maltose transport system substrate-binding protein
VGFDLHTFRKGVRLVKRRALLVVGSIGALALVASLAIAAAGSAGTTDTAAVSAIEETAQSVKPPPVPNAKAIKAKYGGRSITFLGDGPVGKSHTRDQLLVAKFSKDTGIKVKLVPHPVDSSAAYSQLARTFSANSSAFDVMMLDVVWTGAFAPYLYNLKRVMAKQAKLHAKGIILNNTVRGKLVAMPWFGDFGILYFRKDLLTKYGYSGPPKTWAQLGQMAKKIQDGERANNTNFYGFVYQGNAYEGLTCDALEWLASSGGGQFIDGGKVTINNPRAAAILNLQRSWVGTITPRGVTTYQEGESEKAFTAGNAAFMRNWPYAYAIGQEGPIKGKFDVTTLPRTGANAPVGTVGGWQLGISSFSKQPLAAVELVRYLTSPAVERFNAIYNSNVPTIPAVAKLAAVRKVNPWLKPEIAGVARVTRPSRYLGTNYNQGSQIIYQGINQILNGQDATKVLPGVAQRLERALP